jgi:hypothetical protein
MPDMRAGACEGGEEAGTSICEIFGGECRICVLFDICVPAVFNNWVGCVI